MADKIAVLIPCYNESKTVAKVIRDMKKALPEAVIYVYDNNSTDGTDEIARKEGAVVRYEYQQGKGNVIRSMFRDIDAQCYLMVDGDDTYPAEFGNSIVRGSINRLFKSNIKDIMTGYRAMSYRFVKTFPVLSRNFEIETEMTIHAIDKNMQVENVVIEYRDRPEGSESKLNTYADGFKVLKTIVKMFKNYKPLEFFSLIAAVLFVVGMVFFIPVLVHFLEVGTVEKIPTLIVSGFVILTAIICWFSGIILSTLVNQHKQDFEYQTQMVTNRYKDLFPEKK